MSDPHVEGGPDGQEHDRSASSPLGPHVRATGRRISPRAGFSAGTQAAPKETLPAPKETPPTPTDWLATDAPTSGTGLRGSPAGVRAHPHGLRAPETQAPAAAATPRRMAPPPGFGESSPQQPSLGLPRLGVPKIGMPELHRPSLHRPEFHRPIWPLSIRQTVAGAGALTLVIAVVSAMVVVLPNKPVATPGIGSVRDIAFRAAAHPPAGSLDYGPYYVNQGSRLLMMGTDVAVASDGTTSTTTSVWQTTDGSTWTVLSAPSSFADGNKRFVVQGFSSDGAGGLSAVGNASGSSARVEAQAWHSRDGVTWSQASIDYPSNVQMIGLAEQQGRLVSAGNGVAWSSRDGTSWNLMPLPDGTGYLPRVVRAWSGGFEILALSTGTSAPHTAAWVSSDGREWTRTPNMDGFQVQDLVAYGNGLVAVGSQRLTQAELATPTPTALPTPTPAPSGTKATPKPTPTPKKTAAPSGPTPTPTPSPTPSPQVEVATSWISPDGFHWYRGSAIGGRQSPALESVTQVYDSLIAVASEPGAIPGASAAPASPTEPGATPTMARHVSLWTSDDGLTWKPMSTDAAALSHGRLVPFGHDLVLSGVDNGGTFAVLVGSVTLGSPLPMVVATATPPFSLVLSMGPTPMVPGLTADSTLGPLIGSDNRFLIFVTGPDGTSVYTSPDGQIWTLEASPANLLSGGLAPSATPSASPSPSASARKSAKPTAGPSASSSASPGATGEPVVSDAIDDGQGGIVAVGSMTGDNPVAAVWQLGSAGWTAGTIPTDGTAPTSLGSVATQDGNFVAAASSDAGARILYSPDGQSWQAASISGADAYKLTVTAWSGGFIASGSDGNGKSAAWTSRNGQFWVSEASWKLPANLGAIYGTRTGLIATSTSISSGTSWWWSADGKTWQDSSLTTSGGCWGTLDSGLAVVSLPVASGASASAAPAATPTRKPTPRPTGSIVPTPSPTLGFKGSWLMWASRDAKSWQQPMADKFGFDGATTCQVASTQGKVVVVGWAGPGVLRDFVGTLSGL